MYGLCGADVDRGLCEQTVPTHHVGRQVESVQSDQYLPQTTTPLKVTHVFLHQHLQRSDTENTVTIQRLFSDGQLDLSPSEILHPFLRGYLPVDVGRERSKLET